jgi:hypothetical protein
MAMDASKFEAIKNKARKMIHEDAKADSHIIKARQADRNNPKFFKDQPADAYSQVTSFNGSSSSNMVNEAYVDDSEDKLGAAMDNRMKQFMENRQPTQQTQMPRQMNKNLPKEILESFSNNYIDTNALDPDRPVLDRIGITDGTQQITEAYQPTKQVAGGSVDYEIIKSIVESAVKKYVNALGKKMLTENKDNDLAMIQVGDKKINLVTKSGDLYEATLVKKYNIKEKAGRN